MRLIRIGRSDFNEVRLNDSTVSRRHAELVVLGDGRLFLTDCNSTSGTLVEINGVWTKVRQTFVEGDVRARFGNVTMTTAELSRR